MGRRYTPALRAAALLFAAAGGCFQSGADPKQSRARPSSEEIPAITRIDPPSAPSGGPVTARGSGFREGASVLLDGAGVPVLSVFPDRIEFRALGPGTGRVSVEVRNPDGTFARVESGLFICATSTENPEIESVSWGLGRATGGMPFLVRGAGFASGAQVLVGGNPASGVEVLHGGLLRAVSPPCFGPAGPRPVYVTNPSDRYDIIENGYEYVDLGASGTILLGKVEFEKRQVLPEGLSGSVCRECCPWVRVEASGVNPQSESWTAHADAFGCWAMAVSPSGQLRVRAYSAARSPQSPVENVAVMSDDQTQALYGLETGWFPVQAGSAVEIGMLATAQGPYYPAGAFSLARTAVLCAALVREKAGIDLPLLRIFWRSGNAADLYTSFFSARDFGSGEVPVMYVLGGVDGYLDMTDTDEYDESVVAHEFGHFVQQSAGVDSSPGGYHGGEMLVPNLAFSEGFADWFGCLFAGGRYSDTLGFGRKGYMRVSFSPEKIWWQHPVVTGAGSEESVTEILWDMTDGRYPTPDEDGDHVCVDPGIVIQAVASFDPMLHFTSVETFLDAVIAAGSLDGASVEYLLAHPENQGMTYPPLEGGEFPSILEDGRSGFVDALDAYHPPDADWRFWLAASYGNPPNAANGFNSRRYFRFSVDQPCDVVLTLEIDGSGYPPEDLDLHLLDSSHGEIASSATYGRIETLALTCHPGRNYFAEVRGFKTPGFGTLIPSRAGFMLTLEKEAQ